MAHTAEVTPDGWITTDLRTFQILTVHAPPRPWGYWDQIRSDCSESKIVWLWIRGAFLTAFGGCLAWIGVATAQWLIFLGVPMLFRGLWLLSVWGRLAHSVIRRFQTHPIAIGVISGFEPHPIVPTILEVGRASRPSGGVVDVAAEVPLAHAIAQAGIPAEVWFLDDPSWQYQSVFAGRPVSPARR
jgi:hypothetical protein